MKTASPGPSLLKWYAVNKRDLPWRHTKDPYTIWISEIILQQTRVDQGMAYFNRFMKAYPVVEALAAASEEEVLKLWQGLGYYSRARNLHATAKIITNSYNGVFPQEYQDLLKLKGVGDYTASAIASFAFDKPHAVLDGNVFRFLSRYFGIEIPIDGSNAKKEFGQLAASLIDTSDPASYNQAIMEFGALQCKPGIPLCEQCPLIGTCYAFAIKKVGEFPVKSKKLKARPRFFNYLHVEDNDFIFMNRRGKSDIWEGLYDFPMIETEQAINPENLMNSAEWSHVFKKNKGLLKAVSNTFIHKLSHQTIHAIFYELKVKDLKKIETGSGLLIKKDALQSYPLPRLIDLYLQSKA
jgi:A/G-specific adenine glycosylase